MEKIYLCPILKGKDIGKYIINWKGTFVIYPYENDGNLIPESEIKQKSPNLYEYLLSNKNNLAGRSYFDKSSKKWYELWNQRNLNRFKQMKIITLDNASKNSFALDEEGFMSSTTAYSIILRDKRRENYLFTLGILNSKLLDFYHKNNTIPQAGGFFRYQAIFIEKIPIHTKISNKIINLVSSIIEITKNENYWDNLNDKNKVKQIEKQIDEEVYQLYEITKDDIQIINKFYQDG